MSQNPDFDAIFGSDDATTASGGAAATRTAARPRKKKTGRKLLAILLVLVLLVVAAIAAYVFYLGSLWNDNSNQMGEDAVFGGQQPVAEDDGALNILLLGSDARDEDVDYSGDSSGNRSDTIMVMHLSGDRQGAQIMSIPRDTWVDIEGHGQGKINAAMSHGGLPLATPTVSDFIDAPIHHVAIMDFEGFQALTDSVGGVTVESESSFENPAAIPSPRARTNSPARKRWVRPGAQELRRRRPPAHPQPAGVPLRTPWTRSSRPAPWATP